MQEGKSTVIDCTTGKCQCQKFHISFLPTLTCTYDINRFGKRLNSLSVLLLRDGIILIATKNFWSNTAENQTIWRQLTLAWITKMTTQCPLSQMQSSSVAITSNLSWCKWYNSNRLLPGMRSGWNDLRETWGWDTHVSPDLTVTRLCACDQE